MYVFYFKFINRIKVTLLQIFFIHCDPDPFRRLIMWELIDTPQPLYCCYTHFIYSSPFGITNATSYGSPAGIDPAPHALSTGVVANRRLRKTLLNVKLIK